MRDITNAALKFPPKDGNLPNLRTYPKATLNTSIPLDDDLSELRKTVIQSFSMKGRNSPFDKRAMTNRVDTAVTSTAWCDILSTNEINQYSKSLWPFREFVAVHHATASLKHPRACDKAIGEIQKNSGQSDWDGEGTDPVTDQVLSVAREVSTKIPWTLPTPDITPDCQGHVEFHWELDNVVFTMSIGPEKDVAIYGKSDKGAILRGWSKMADDDPALPSLVPFSLQWLQNTVTK